ncbi:hypothetical protein DYH09_15075 [bacterium CPR1]|nr:hypothetical protein [bacterium CPR1]
MEQLLASLRQEGRSDESGRFTLHPERAREVMGRYLSADPHRYPLLFVTAACVLGAHSLDFQEGRRFVFGGVSITKMQIESIFSHLLEEGGLRSLALGLLMAEQLEPARITLESSGTRLVLRKGKMTSERSAPGQDAGLIVELQLKREWLRLGKKSEPPDLVLARWARYAPIPVRVDGRPINRPYRPDTCLACLVIGEVHVDGVEGIILHRSPAPGDYRAVLVPGPRIGQPQDFFGAPGPLTNLAPSRNDFLCLVDGVAYPAHGLLPYWVRGLLVTPLARPDLSLSAIVETEELRSLAQELLQQLGPLMQELSQAALPEASDVLRHYAALKGGSQGIEILQAVLACVLTPEDRALTLIQIATMEEQCGQLGAAESHLREALVTQPLRSRRLDLVWRLSEILRQRFAPAEERRATLEEWLELLTRLGRKDPRQERALEQLAELSQDPGQARGYLVRLLQEREVRLGPNHPELTPILNRLALLCARTRPLDAESYRQRSLEIWSYAHGRGCEPPPDPP